MKVYFKSRYQEILQKNFPKGMISLSWPQVIKKPSHQKQKSVGKINCGMRHKINEQIQCVYYVLKKQEKELKVRWRNKRLSKMTRQIWK